MDLSKPAKAKPADIVAALRTFEPEVAFASPVVWQNLSRHCLDNNIELLSIKTAITVGAPIPAYLHRRFRKILSEDAQIWTPYGATEGLPVSYIATDEILGETWDRTAKGHGTCVGHTAPGMEIAIIGITEDPIASWSDDLKLPVGEIGEVVIKGRQVSPEYKDVPGANEKAKIPDGGGVRHRMGDLGYIDEVGRLWFCGRKAHRLQTAHAMIPAVPVEGVFNEHPDVFRTALVGIGPTGSEIPVLCVEMEPGKSWSPEVEAALVALGADTDHADVVERFLHNASFPTDARHNSKIRREDLKLWAETRCSDLKKKAAA
jgi:acyl-CoA synthetase (AMP-forming)/AMP-acid ligase II